MAEFVIRQARPDDVPAMARRFAAVAEERGGIATEPPLDVEQLNERFGRSADTSIVAEARGQIIGMLGIEPGRFGYGDIGMVVDAAWRGRGVGSALVHGAIDWARNHGLHKLCLEVFPANTAAIALYRKCGFVEEGLRTKQYRRANGELWDAIAMGLLL